VAFSGAHDATIAAVAAGKVQAGALNISVWEKFVAEKKVDPTKVRVIYTTPPYYDYNWTVHADLPAATARQARAGLLALKPGTPQADEILKLQRATRFVPEQGRELQGHRSRRKNAGLL
jgi:phosphonate transport system substrate-binding protein